VKSSWMRRLHSLAKMAQGRFHRGGVWLLLLVALLPLPTDNGNGGPLTKSLARLTKSVLRCLFYYTLTNGGHPYGDRFEREVNIMKDAKDVGGVERFGEERYGG